MSNYGQPPPPYPYQQQQEPIQGQHSGDYASYPQVNQQQADQRWGTPVMGAPSNPSAHPDNQHAAAGGFGGVDRQKSGSFNEQVYAAQAQSAPSNAGQVPAQGQSPYVQSAPTSGTAGKGIYLPTLVITHNTDSFLESLCTSQCNLLDVICPICSPLSVRALFNHHVTILSTGAVMVVGASAL
jgi:hypothetical protein